MFCTHLTDFHRGYMKNVTYVFADCYIMIWDSFLYLVCTAVGNDDAILCTSARSVLVTDAAIGWSRLMSSFFKYWREAHSTCSVEIDKHRVNHPLLRNRPPQFHIFFAAVAAVGVAADGEQMPLQLWRHLCYVDVLRQETTDNVLSLSVMCQTTSLRAWRFWVGSAWRRFRDRECHAADSEVAYAQSFFFVGLFSTHASRD